MWHPPIRSGCSIRDYSQCYWWLTLVFPYFYLLVLNAAISQEVRICHLNDTLHSPRTYSSSGIVFSDRQLIVGSLLWKVFQRYHFKWTSSFINDGLISCQAWLETQNNAGQRIFPWEIICLDKSIFQELIMIESNQLPSFPETAWHYATWLLDLRGNLLWLKERTQHRVWRSSALHKTRFES